MSSRMTGRVATDVSDGQGPSTALAGVRVSVHTSDDLAGFELDSTLSDANGQFALKYFRDSSEGDRRRNLFVRVHDIVGRELRRFGPIRDDPIETLTQGDLVIPADEATGRLVTLGTGEPRASAATLPGWGLSEGNRVVWLMDRDAFERAAELITSARESVLMSQLFFSVPPKFAASPAAEQTKLIFDFATEPKPPPPLRKVEPGDSRPERLMLAAADRGVPVRLLLHSFEVPWFVKVIASALIFPFLGAPGVLAMVLDWLNDDLSDLDEHQRYFGAAGRPKIRVRPFEQNVLSAGVMHAKLVSIDQTHALSIGSPFGQSYVDTARHVTEAPIRGNTEGLPKHDAGFGITGPGAKDVFRTLKLLWDEDAPAAEQVPDPEPPLPPGQRIEAPPLPERVDGVCSVQLVRTLTAGRFKNHEAGEKGILEAYLRAIGHAKDFIYLETQYFTNDAIGYALVEAMKRNPKLQTILLLNIQPDVPFYPFKQRRLITRIREGIGQPAGQAPRFGVFTRWSHEPAKPNANPPQPRATMLPVYVHAKAAVVDDEWATVGSANLDGLSLDSSLVSDVLNFLPGKIAGRPLFREQRAVEVNGVMFDGVDGQPESPVPRILRRKLWAEHLGFFAGPDRLDVDALALLERPQGGWLSLWNQRAAATLQRLRDKPGDPLVAMATVLPWPDEDTTYKYPRVHLTALGIKSHQVIPLKSTRAFDFDTGDWKPKSKAKMDYD